MKIKTVVLLLLSFSFHTVHAQEEPVWPPDPSTIFTSNVEIVEMEIITPAIATETHFFCDGIHAGWIYWENHDDQQVLCNTVTGELSPPLPANAQYAMEEQQRSLSFSPDGRYITIIGDLSTSPASFAIHTYDTITKTFTYVGEIKAGMGGPVRPRGWVSNTRGTVVDWILGDSVSDKYFTFDAAIPNSLEEIGLAPWLDYFDNPPRYEYLRTVGLLQFESGIPYSHETLPCNLMVYDANGIQNYDLGYDCLSTRIFRHENLYMTLTVESGNSKTSTLTLIDIQRNLTVPILSGEFEWLESLSPDGNYALVVMGDNGMINIIDHYPLFDSFGHDEQEAMQGIAYSAVIDIREGKIIFDSRDLNISSETWVNYSFIPIQWCGSQCLLFIENDQIFKQITIDETFEISTIEYPDFYYSGDQAMSPNGEQVFVTNHRNGLDVLDFHTESVIPILVDGAKSLVYRNEVKWISDDLLQMTLAADDQNQIIYTLRILKSTN